MTPTRRTQVSWLAVAAACFAAAGLLQGLRRTKADLFEIVPGRAFLVNYLWIRTDQLKEQGRFYDAMQQAELICRLQRHFPGVWSFHSWNMAWNISVEKHTPEERWRWVYNGLRLLRDEGIPLNRKSIVLYKDLGWIFFFKIGGYLDDMHWVYKRQWAVRMQDLLGAPPDGNTAEVIDAFRPIAEAPLDKDLDRQGRAVIQPGPLEELLADSAVADYAELLGRVGVEVGPSLLAAYNRYTVSPDVAAVRVRPPQPRTEHERDVYRLINAPDHAVARARLLAFVRAQVLWNVFKMDPDWMLGLMERYGPLDWRLPQPHGLYWLTLGREVSTDAHLSNIDALNAQRNAFNCLKELTWRGRLTMIDARPREAGPDALALEPVAAESSMDVPRIRLRQLPDLRYVQPLHEAYLRAIHELTGGVKRRFHTSMLADGHVNYLRGAIKGLYASYRREEAQRYYDWLRENYQKSKGEWAFDDVEDFVLYGLRRETEPNRDLAENQIGMSLVAGMVALGRGDSAIFERSLAYARRVHAVYQGAYPVKRMGLPPLDSYIRVIAVKLLVRPRSLGHNLTLTERSRLYRAMDTNLQRDIFHTVREPLEALCETEGVDFATAFPEPENARPARRRRGAPAGEADMLTR